MCNCCRKYRVCTSYDVMWARDGCEDHQGSMCVEYADVSYNQECSCECGDFYDNSSKSTGKCKFMCDPTSARCNCGRNDSNRNGSACVTTHVGGKGCEGKCEWISTDVDETKYISIRAGCGNSDKEYKDTPNKDRQEYTTDFDNTNFGTNNDTAPQGFDTRFAGAVQNGNGKMGKSCSASLTLDNHIAKLLVRGGENGYACDTKGTPETASNNGTIEIGGATQTGAGSCGGTEQCKDCTGSGDGIIKIDNNNISDEKDRPEDVNIYSSAWDTTDEYKEENFKGIVDSTGYFNYIYLWTTPYALDYLVFGESGQAGEYKAAQKSDVTDTLFITLGEGGTPQSPNGKPTVIEYGANKEIILMANGGSAGIKNQKTDNFNMCYNAINPDKFKTNDNNDGFKINDNPSYYCTKNPDHIPVAGKLTGNDKIPDDGVFCCTGSKATKNTKDIMATAIKLSEFDRMAASTNNSLLVGLGMGRSGEGTGSTTYNEEIVGVRVATNVSTSAGYSGNKTIVREISPLGTPTDNYKNYTLTPPELYLNAAGGAVIIMW